MTESRLLLYATWSDAPERGLLRGLRSIHEQQVELYDLLPAAPFRWEEVHLRIGKGFVLFLAEQHWSPGDIGGTLKGGQFVPSDASVMAVVVDTGAYYLSHHGLSEGFAEQLDAFSKFHRRHRLIRRC